MLKLLTALTIAFSAPTLALAATDGTLGDSSSGTANITFNVTDAITPKIQISGLQDLTLQSTSASLGDIKPSSPVCVYMTEAGSFALTVTAEPLLFGTGDLVTARMAGHRSCEFTVPDQAGPVEIYFEVGERVCS